MRDVEQQQFPVFGPGKTFVKGYARQPALAKAAQQPTGHRHALVHLHLRDQLGVVLDQTVLVSRHQKPMSQFHCRVQFALGDPFGVRLEQREDLLGAGDALALEQRGVHQANVVSQGLVMEDLGGVAQRALGQTQHLAQQSMIIGQVLQPSVVGVQAQAHDPQHQDLPPVHAGAAGQLLVGQHLLWEQRRGACYQLSYTFQMRSRTEYVRPEEVAERRREIAEYKRYKRLSARWVALSLQRAKLRVKEARAAGVANPP